MTEVDILSGSGRKLCGLVVWWMWVWESYDKDWNYGYLTNCWVGGGCARERV